MRSRIVLALMLVAAHAEMANADDFSPSGDDSLDMEQIEASGALIGTITIRTDPIFDPSKPGEDRLLFKLADRLHIDTREEALRAQLLFAPGDRFSRRVIVETERNLRKLVFIREPRIRPVRFADGRVDLEVSAREVWTTSPGLSFGREGGANSTSVHLEDLNLFGTGKQLTLKYGDDVDRSSYVLRWVDPNVRGSRWRSHVELIRSDDGDGYGLGIERPFVSLDARWSAGVRVEHAKGQDWRYLLGEPTEVYGRDRDELDAYFGASSGLHNGRTHRLTAGVRYDVTRFSRVVGDARAAEVLPQDRALVYPYLRLESIEDDFATVHNQDQLARTEDVCFGTRLALEIGRAAPAFGADRTATILRFESSRGVRLADDSSLFLSASLAGRFESLSPRDALLATAARYYRRTSPRTTLYAAVQADFGHALDADHELVLGGEEGLRGFPLRYQSGSSRAVFTLEERFYTDWSIWRIAHVGAAVFADVGRAWGDSTLDVPDQGMLSDVGVGLRLGNSRSARANVLHLDVALPLGAHIGAGGLQFLVQTRRSF